MIYLSSTLFRPKCKNCKKMMKIEVVGVMKKDTKKKNKFKK